MFKILDKIRIAVLRRLYKLLIFRVIVLDRSSTIDYHKAVEFYSIKVLTTKGEFFFKFKEDRRVNKCRDIYGFNLVSYIVELIPPEDIAMPDGEIENTVILAVKIMLFKVDPAILSGVLVDIYNERIVERLRWRYSRM